MSFMATLRSSAHAKLVEVRDANPTVLGQVHKARPASLSIVGVSAYVGDCRPSMRFTNQLRQWTGTELDVVLVSGPTDNEETQDRLDVAGDLVLDAFSADHHFAGADMVGEPTRVRMATELEANGTSYPAMVITLGNISHLEGGY